jgi:hypothetical protein
LIFYPSYYVWPQYYYDRTYGHSVRCFKN